MKTFEKRFRQDIPIKVDFAWDFFSSPLNLALITPPEMQFQVTSAFKPETRAYAGMIITYTVTPLFGIRMNWMTEITHIKEGEYFIDEQRFGPYALWHHQHHFEKVEGGVRMNDILNYAIPYGPIGQLANTVLVGKKIDEIFDYRRKAIEERFGLIKPQENYPSK